MIALVLSPGRGLRTTGLVTPTPADLLLSSSFWLDLIVRDVFGSDFDALFDLLQKMRKNITCSSSNEAATNFADQ